MSILLFRGDPQHLFSRKRWSGFIFSEGILDGNGVGGGFHACRIDAIQLLHVREDLFQLIPEGILLLVR